MRIDPSQLSEPLAHVLGVQKTDAKTGQQNAAAADQVKPEAQFEQLDALLAKRLRLNAIADSANSVISAQDAAERVALLKSLQSQNPDQARSASGTLDSSRVRGLLDG